MRQFSIISIKRLSALDLYRKVVIIVILINMLSVSTPASTETMGSFAKRSWQDARFAFLSGGFDRVGNQVLAMLTIGKTNIRQDVSTMKIVPGSLTVATNVETVFAAIAYDSNNEPISGIDFEWIVRDAETGQVQNIFTDSKFKSGREGIFTLTASANGKESSETISVFEAPQERGQFMEFEISSRSGRLQQKEQEGGQENERTLPGDGWDDTNWPSADDPGNQTGNPPGVPMDGGAGNGNFQFSAPVISLPGRGIDVALNLNYNSRVWNKAGNTVSYDVDWDEPAAGWNLGFGRMISMGNSGGCMIVDADGTRRGYGGSVSSSTSGTWMNFKGNTTDGSFIDYGCGFTWGNYGSGWSQLPNGTYITYSSITPTEAHLFPTMIRDAQGNYITVTYRNASGNALIETVTDTMGRVITFNYDNLNRLISVTGPRMTDQDASHGTASTRTLVKLHYKSLTLGYSFASGTTPIVRNGSVWVIDSIYYPATNTGYWFNDSDSYSSYGMLTKVIEQRGMSWSSSSETQGVINAGTMTKRAEYNYPLTAANVSGRTNGTGLSDAPTYDSLKEDWDGMDVAGPVETRYKVLMNSNPRVTNVIQPNGSVSKQFSYNNPGNFNDGLVYQDETYVPDAAGTFTFVSDLGLTGNFKRVAKSNVSWQAGHYDTPRPTLAEVWDENGHKVSTQYTYDTSSSGRFNQMLKSCDYDHAGTKLKCAVAEYENSTNYTGYFNTSGKFVSGQHIFNLIKSTGIENPDGTLASLTKYEYDNYTTNPLSNTPGVIQHSASHNPHNSSTYACNCEWSCEFSLRKNKDGKSVSETEENRRMAPPNCENGLPPWWVCQQCPVYQSETLFRGNVTKITTYADAENEMESVNETRAYDMTGNVTKISSSCCEEKSFLYDDPSVSGYETQYAFPVSQTHGSSNPSSPDRITTKTTYSYNSGLITETRDANNLPTVRWYHPDTLRPEKTVSSTGAFTLSSYDDNAMTVTEEVFENTTSSPSTAGKSKKYLNGVGQVRKEESFAPSSIVDIAETKYTQFGEIWKQSRPYRSGDTVQWSEKFYDAQRRLTKVVEPDGSETKAFYNESSFPDSVTSAPGNRMRVMDAWGRDRWGRYDQQGRLVEVVEPNPDGTVNTTGSVLASGSLLTKYSYDTQGRLTQTEQGSQFRKFKYDDLGRLTRQKLAEQTATLDTNGDFVGSSSGGAQWSEAFEYDSRSNLTQKTDARGVKTKYSYQVSGGGQDPLNRLQSRTYDTSGTLQPGLTIYNIWGTSVSYEYMTAGDKTRIKKVTTANMLVEDYTYDPEARVNGYTQTQDGRPSKPMAVNYLYDSLDRVKEVTYPEQYELTPTRKIVEHKYDSASRLSSLEYDGVQQAGNIVYDAADQTTQIKIGAAGANQVTEDYTFDQQTGLLTNQTATMGSTTLLDLSYDYGRNGSVGSLSGKAGHLTKITNNLDTNKNRDYEFDVLGRLTKAKGGTTGTLWNQTYSYDRYGNRTNVAATGTAADSSPIPLDGVPNLTYDNTSNRITTSGYEYDVAGNMIRALAADGVTWLRYHYDAANRIQVIRKDDVNQTDVQAFQYGSTNARLIDWDALGTGFNTFYASVGGQVLTEYVEVYGSFTWSKSYTYLGSTQLATLTPNGSGGEKAEFSHPDRLGAKIKTNQAVGTSSEQSALPFGTALNAESTLTNDTRRFTSYERSTATGLDYAINRTYDSKLGRFTQVDPIRMRAARLMAPQTLNMFAYCGSDPVNYTDPNGLNFFSWLWNGIKAFFGSGLARRVAVRFVVSYVVSGGNIGVAFRSIVPDLLRQIGLSPNAFLTPSWNPNLPNSVTFGGVGSLSRYLIQNFKAVAKETILSGECWSISELLQRLGPALTEAWGQSKDGKERGGILAATKSGEFKGYYLPPGDKESIDSLPSSRLIRKEAGIDSLAIQFHTHPRGGRTPTGIAGSVGSGGDFGVLNRLDLDTNSRPAAPYGIIKYGPKVDDVTVYDRNGIISPKDFHKSVGCFPDLREVQ